jgi:hypothetical protein
MKITLLFFTVIMLGGLEIHADDSQFAPGSAASSFKSTLKEDEHDQPVFTSPTNGSAINAFADSNSIPMPAITNWPATNLPPMTNPPPLQPDH